MEHEAIGAAIGADQSGAGEEEYAGVGTRAEQRFHERLGVEDAALGRPESRDRRHRRLTRVDEAGVDELQPFDAVRRAAPRERLELIVLAGVMRNNQLAAFHVGNGMLRAELVQQAPTLDAQPRFQRTGGIVEAGVNHAAVVRARFEARPSVPLDQAHGVSTHRDGASGGEPGHAGADDGDVNVLHHVSRAAFQS